jgi:hypothetical protein
MRSALAALLVIVSMPVPTAEPPARNLDAAVASRFAKQALDCVEKEYPNKPDHVMNGLQDATGPKAQHPAFYGCFDWHSSVHGHWMLARLLRLHPDLPEGGRIRTVLATHLAPGPIATELAYLDPPGRKAFERTYGWAWLLKLDAELRTWEDPQAKAWEAALRPLAARIAADLSAFLDRLSYPIRSGVHPNTAFTLSLALDYAEAAKDSDLSTKIRARSLAYFSKDESCPLFYEPSGEDFLSGCLEEAALMARVLQGRTYHGWLDAFLPALAAGKKLQPAIVSDRSDPRIVHLDGLNLSRAENLSRIAARLGTSDPRRAELLRLADAHLDASLPYVTGGSYEGGHWLATYAVRALESRQRAK